MINNKKRLSKIFCVLLFAIGMTFTSCKKLVESPPPTNIVAESNVYSIDATAIAVLNGIYISMNTSNVGQPIQGRGGISVIAGISADELTPYSGAGLYYFRYYQNQLSGVETINPGSDLWRPLYSFVFRCNAAIEGLNSLSADKLTPVVKRQLIGEAKFMRSFFYFYLINLFGDVPLALTTDPEINIRLSRAPKIEVYHQIISDLKEAEELLSDGYLGGNLLSETVERIRPTKWAAKALLARAYLYTEQWDNADATASQIIANTNLYGPLPSLNNVFLKNSREAIWQLQPTAANFNTQEALTFIIPASGPSSSSPVYLSKEWLNNFENTDQRKILGNWVDTTIYKITNNPVVWDTLAYPNKYKNNISNSSISNTTGTQFMTEFFMVLRLGEQYLIRAEARAHVNKIAEAQSDLNAIRTRAGLVGTTAGDQSSLLTAILKERQLELFSEWGHRWFDLKRMGKVDEVMSVMTPLKSGGQPWQSFQQLYPLPKGSDLNLSQTLIQNSGY